MTGLWTEGEVLLKEIIPETGEKTIPGGELACNIIARMMSYILVGPSLCRNPEWQQVAIEATFATIDASLNIRARYSPNWRWLARWQDNTAQRLEEIRDKGRKLIGPLYDERRQTLDQDHGRIVSGPDAPFHDTIYWILGRKGGSKSLGGIVDQQLFLTLASIHSTAGTLQSMLFDWLAHPEFHAEIRAEINEALAEFRSSGGKWTLQRVAAMKKLDSFMKESTRVNPIGFSKSP